MKADLHVHTNASDGFLTREQLLDIAYVSGIDTIAITDHDAIGNSYAKQGDKVRVITGIELSAINPINGRNLHVLCYLPKEKEAFTPLIENAKNERNRAGEIMIKKASKYYPILTVERVWDTAKETGSIFKQHIIQVLIDFGYTKELYGDEFKFLFGKKSGCCKEDPIYFDAYTVFNYVRESRSVVSIAHPTIYDSLELSVELAKMGLIDALEVNHPRNNPNMVLDMKKICLEHNLFETAGSDYHGRNNSKTVMVGEKTLDEKQLNKLFEASERK